MEEVGIGFDDACSRGLSVACRYRRTERKSAWRFNFRPTTARSPGAYGAAFDEEYLVWLTAMGKRRMPQPAPVWFWWDQQARNFLIYNQTAAKRLELIRLNHQVALNFNGYGTGFGIIVFVGTAEITDDPPAHQHPLYLAKYQHWMTVKFGSPEKFAAGFSVPVRVHPLKVRGSSA